MSGTSKGLTGRWFHFTSDNAPLPPNSLVTRCVAGRRNQVWINVCISQGIGVPAKEYGLFLTDGANWFEYKLGEHGLPVKAIQDPVMATDSANRLWALVYDFGLCRFDGQSVMAYEYGQPGFLEDVWITDILVDKLDRVWLATLGRGLYTLLPSGAWQRIIAESEVGLTDRIVALGTDWKDNLWIACEDKKETRFLSKRSDTWEHFCSFPLGLKHMDEVACFAVDRNDNVWVGRRFGGLMVWNGKSWKVLTEKDCSLLYGDINSVTADEYGNVWVCPGGGGVAVFDGVAWHSWVAVQPGDKQQPVGREDLLRATSTPGTEYIRLGRYVAGTLLVENGYQQ